MKTKTRNTRTAGTSLSAICLNSSRHLLEQLGQVKEDLLAKYGDGSNGRENILQGAMREAEALAWQTPFPHLFFPVLAEEKLKAARRWAGRQELVRHVNPARVLAA